MAEIAATAASYTSSLVSFVAGEGTIVRDYFTGTSTAKSAMKGIQCVILNDNTRTGKKNYDTLDQGARAVETLFDFRETFDRIVKVGNHLPLIITGQESFTDVIYDGLDLGVSTISTIRGFTRAKPGKWGLRTVSDKEYNYWTLAKMSTSALWKGSAAIGKWDTKMDPFKRARDIFIVVMLTQCAVNAFFNCYREDNQVILDKFESDKARYDKDWNNGLERLLFYCDPIKPIKHDSIVRYFGWIESIFCNSLVRRGVGVGITVSAFTAHRNASLAAPAA